MLLFGGSQFSFFFPMLHFGGPQLLPRFPMLFALACCCTQAFLPPFPSTKTRFLCFFGLWNPCFRAFRAQNRGFCVRKGNFSPVLPPFEHKIGVFVSKWAIFPRFWVVLTQNRHFCARGWLPRVQQCPLKPSRAHRSSAPPATSPAGCILQQCARQ